MATNLLATTSDKKEHVNLNRFSASLKVTNVEGKSGKAKSHQATTKWQCRFHRVHVSTSVFGKKNVLKLK